MRAVFPSNIRHRNLVLLCLVAGGLMACQPVWVKEGEGGQEFNAAANDCNAVARIGYYGVGISGELNKQAALDRCIAAHGFRQVDPRNVPPGIQGHPVVAPAGIHTTRFLHEGGGLARF